MMRRLLPRSLFGRLVLVLLAGLLLAQLASAVLLLRDRGLAVHQASGFQLAQRAVTVVHLLDSLEPKERHRIARGLEAPGLRIALRPEAVPLPADGDEHLTQRFRRLLGRALEEERQFSVWVGERPPAPPERPTRPHWRGAPRPLPEFIIQVQLGDGSWVRFDHRPPAELFANPQRLILILAVLLGSVVLLSLLAVRWVTRPLAALSAAAEGLGRNLNQPPLNESGPSEVRRAASAFNAMQRSLVRYIADRERLLSSVSHDLRTPLTRMRLRAELVDDPPLQGKLLQDIGDMEAMVHSTLDFIRGSGEGEPLHPVDLNALVESLGADMEELGFAVRVVGRVEAPYPARPTALKRCLTNLVDNAVKYGGSAAITLTEEGRHVRIAVADEGPGLPESELEHVFEPFYRGEPSRSRATGGVGLGLSIARNIARAHGGDLTLHNRPQGGLEAVLVLPR